MADYLKLFYERRLSPSEDHHLEFIKGRLANLKVEDAKAYAEYSEFYGVDLDVTVKKVPETKAVKAEKLAVKKALKIK